MSFLIYLHKNEFQPEEPQILDGHLKSDTQLTFIDFIPSITKRSSTSIMSSNEIEYHPFKKMVETANEWLKENPNYDVINCETIKIFFKYNDTQNFYDLRMNDVSHYIYGTEKNNLLKALRLWVKQRKETVNEEQTTVVSADATNLDDSLSPLSPQQESPKLSNLTSVLKRRWTQPQQQFQKQPNKQTQALNLKQPSQSQVQNVGKVTQLNEPHSTEHSPKKSAFQQQQAFRLQQYSSQSKFYLNKLQRQASCPQSNSLFQTAHNAQGINSSIQNSPVYQMKQSHNLHQTNQINSPQTQEQSNNNIQSSLQQQELKSPEHQSKINKITNSDPIILNYVDIIPECNEISESNKQEKFERLDDCVEKLNDMIKNGLIKGKILSIETSTCEATVDWTFDTELSFTAITSKNVNFLRCFYLETESSETDQRLRIVDFIPDHLSGGGFFKKPKFENFSLIFPKVTEWLSNNPNYEFKNAQTLDVKLKNYVSQNQMGVLDTKSMSFTEHGDYLRILRLVYSERTKLEENQKSLNEQLISINRSINNLLEIKDIEEDGIDRRNDRNGYLKKQNSDASGHNTPNRNAIVDNDSLDKNCKINASKDIENTEKSNESVDCDDLVMKLREYSNENNRPIYLTSKLFLIQRKGQSINDLKQEIQEWFKTYESTDSCERTGPRIKPKILYCETIQIFCKQDDPTNLQKAVEETFMYNRFGSKNGYIVNVFRIYFDIGWFAFERLGYGLKLSQSQKIRRKRLDYSASVDEEHLKEASGSSIHPKVLNRRESVAEFFKDRNRDHLQDLALKAKLNSQTRRRSCNVNSFERKLSTNMTNLVCSKPLDKEVNKNKDDSSGKLSHESAQDPENEKNYENLMNTCLSSEFSSISMLANLSEGINFQSSNGSISIPNEERFKFINQLNEKSPMPLKLKDKIKKLNISLTKRESVDGYRLEQNTNCQLM